MGAAAISVSVPMDRERTEKGGEHVGGGLTRKAWGALLRDAGGLCFTLALPKKLETCRFVVEKTAGLPILGESLTGESIGHVTSAVLLSDAEVYRRRRLSCDMYGPTYT